MDTPKQDDITELKSDKECSYDEEELKDAIEPLVVNKY